MLLKKSEIVLIFKNKMRRDPKILSTTYPSNIEELQMILKKVDSWNICLGPPNVPTSERLKQAKVRKIIEDEGKPRHADCEMFVENGVICRKCLSVERLLSQLIDRMNKKTLGTSLLALECLAKAEKIVREEKKAATERLQINATPRSKDNLQKLRRQYVAMKKKLNRRDKFILHLEEKIREIGQKDVKLIENFLKEHKVPEAQVRLPSAVYAFLNALVKFSQHASG